MFRALMICTDGDCDAAFDAVGTLDDLLVLACDCGCALSIDSLAETDQAPSTVEILAVSQ